MANGLYKMKLSLRENTWSIMLALYILTFLFFIFIYYFSNSDEVNYKKYKDYETSINKKQIVIISNIEKSIKAYSENKIHKRNIIYELRQGSYKLEKLYSSFSWDKGDENTKSLFIIKKQVILNTAQIYSKKAEALEVGFGYNEKSDREFIDILMERYNLNETFEKEKFDLKF